MDTLLTNEATTDRVHCPLVLFLDMESLPPRAERHLWLRYEGQEYTDVIIQDFKEKLSRILWRQVHMLQVLDYGALTKEMDQAINDRLRMDHTEGDGKVVFTSHAWRRMFEIRGTLVRELMLEFFSTYRFSDIELGEPEGSDDFTEVPFDDEQILGQHNTAHGTPPPLACTLTPPVLATMEPLNTFLMGDEFELTLDSTDLECSMPIDLPLPWTDVLGDTIVDIDLLLGEHLDTFSIGDREIDFNPIRDIEELEHLL
ncbi:hypothetical protein Tco_0393830 [Tanacetum coccineum]